MALVPGSRQIIELPVSPRDFAGLKIAQKACFRTLLHTQDALGECLATITVALTMHAPGPGGDPYGPALSGGGFAPREEILTADNQTLVDAATGQILAIRSGEDNEAWQAKAEGFTQPTMLQGDFFEYLRENIPVKIGDMIRTHIQQADAMGRFA